MAGAPRTTPQLRARLKRVFAAYYLDLCSDSIATPGPAYEATRDYFEARSAELGADLLRSSMDDEIAHLYGEIEQDLRQRHRADADEILLKEPLDARFRECVDAAWGSD